MAENNGNGNVATLRAIEDVTAFPILTEDLGSAYPSGRAATPSLDSTAAIGRIVRNALGNVLNWKPREDEPKAFVSALTRSYDLFDVEGHTVAKYVANRYAVDADLGAVTGAQASIYARGRAFLDQSSPLLRNLIPLRTDFDQQDMDAIRSIVEGGVGELVSELGQQGGPRLVRVDQLFLLLLGTDADPKDSEQVGGQLGLLRERFGLARRFVNTISEEEALTNYLILVDGIRALRHTWVTQRAYFDRRGTDVFLGTQAVLLSRSLGVIAEAVGDAYTVMDSVFLGPAERQVARLHLKDGGNIFLSELLEWVNEFAVDEGPRLVRDGGKDGVIYAFLPTIRKLAQLTREAADFAAHVPGPRTGPVHAATAPTPAPAPAAAAAAGQFKGGGIPTRPSSSLNTPRVIRALDALATQCENARNLASQLKRTIPHLISVNPDTVPGGRRVKLTIDGSDFPDTPDLRLVLRRVKGPGVISAVRATRISASQIDAEFDLTGVTDDDLWSVVLSDPDDATQAALHGALAVTAGPDGGPVPPKVNPKVTAVGPDYAYAGDMGVQILLAGQGLDPSLNVAFGGELPATIDPNKPHDSGILWVLLDVPATTTSPETVTTQVLVNGFPISGPPFQIKKLPSIAKVQFVKFGGGAGESGLTLAITGDDLLDVSKVQLTVVIADNQNNPVAKVLPGVMQTVNFRDASALPPVTFDLAPLADAHASSASLNKVIPTVTVFNPDGRGSDPVALTGGDRDEVMSRLFPAGQKEQH